MNSVNELQSILSVEVLQRAVFENYESIYVIDLNTYHYYCFHQSDSFSTLKLDDSGNDFFRDAAINILGTIYYEDRIYVRKMITRDALLKGLTENNYYSFVYRLMIDGVPLYHKFRAIRETVEGKEYIMIGIRNIDDAFRQDKAQTDALSHMQQKERNHLEAVLASAAGYLEANLTRDLVLEYLPYSPAEPIEDLCCKPGSYSRIIRRLSEELVCKNRDRFIEISDREYLICCYSRGENRASVSFSSRLDGGYMQPCKIVFYLYQDDISGDIMAFCVIYDLTEQQKREQEMEELEQELQMSRIRNILDDPEYAAELIGDFTIHLRSCIRAMADDTLIPFEKELENIRAYVNIEKMRFGDRLQVEYDIGTDDFRILPLCVQPIVENAIRHGIYNRGKAGGKVTISTSEDDNSRIITVSDNGVGFNTDILNRKASDDLKESTGLKNLMFRLDKVMHAGIDISSTEGVGTTVVITIPKEEI